MKDIIKDAVLMLEESTYSKKKHSKLTACIYLKKHLDISLKDAIEACRIATIF